MSCGNCENECGSCEVNELTEAEQQLDTINSDRARGLAKLNHKVKQLLDSEEMTVGVLEKPQLVSLLRDMTQALDATLLTQKAQNEIMNMLINDLIGLADKSNKLNQNLFMTGSHLQTLMKVLDTKGIITENEMRLTWQQIQEEFVKQQGQSSQ